MRSKFLKSVAVAIAAFVMLAAAPLAPSAEAQVNYAPRPPAAVNCSDLPGFELILQDTAIVVVIPEIYLQCVIRLVITSAVVVYDGPPPASLILRIRRTDTTCVVPTSATATTIDGVLKVETLDLTTTDVVCVPAVTDPTTTGLDPTAIVLDPLATTGSNVRMPVALGALLVGAGGIVLLMARKREELAVAI